MVPLPKSCATNPNCCPPDPVIASDPILVLENVHASYVQKEILRGLSFTVRRGEIVALLGENGSGKSTTLKVIAGLLKPAQGSVRFHGKELNGLGAADRQQLGIGYLMQGGRVFPNLTVEENFNLALGQAPKGTSEAPPCLGDWFTALNDRRATRAGLLSGGQRQMLAIELVLAQRPNLLLLDEPTGALSGELATQVLKATHSYVKRHDASAILVEHLLTATDYSTTQLHLLNGALK
jgi:ABC-type branched-subunit amino acid transport system ATPase component